MYISALAAGRPTVAAWISRAAGEDK